MKIKSMTIGNFRNLAETTLDLNRITAIISINNYGKTNLLEAIQFGFEFITASAKIRNNMMRWVKYIPLTPSLAGKDYKFCIEFDEPKLGEYRYVRYSFSFSWANDQNTGAVITDESIDIRSAENIRYTSYLKRDKGQYKAGKSKTGFRKITLAKDILAVDVLSAIDDIDIADVITAIKGIKCTMCDTLELSSSFHPSVFEFDFEQYDLPLNDGDIPRALSVLRREYPEKFDTFIETVYDLFPEFTKIDLQSSHLSDDRINQPQIFFVEKTSDDKENAIDIPYHIKDEIHRLMITSKYLNQPISMEFMSTGTKRILWLIANSIFGNSYGINLIGVDEVETSIHPKLIRQLLESLNENLGNASMLLTSHSPFLIQYLKPNSIFIGVPNEDGTASFRRINNSKTKELLRVSRGLEMSIGEYIFELMSGDDDSSDILKAYLE